MKFAIFLCDLVALHDMIVAIDWPGISGSCNQKPKSEEGVFHG